ncbi:MAG: hypothetical protein HRT53_18360 [Colwellia sp.]|nr:hypothetical protein [Colwellia sp.]
MNKQLGLLWGLSLLITFYLGYGYKSLSPAQPAELTSSTNNSIATVNDLLAGKENIKLSAVTPDQNKQSNSNDNDNDNDTKLALTKAINITESIGEIKSILGNGMNIAGIAKAYIMISDFNQQDLEKALAQLENTANQPDNASLLSLLLVKYAEQNPQESMDYINSNITSPQSKSAAANSVIGVWSNNDPLSAYDWFLNQQKHQDKKGSLPYARRALYSIFSGLTKQDFHGAIDKLIDISSDSGNGFMAVYGMADVLTKKDEFAELMNRTSELADIRLKNNVVQSWVKRDPQEAIEWVDSVDDIEGKAQLQKEVFSGWLATEPKEAANWYLSSAAPEEKQLYADKIIKQWGMFQAGTPEDALDWLSQQTEIDLQKSTATLLKSSAYSNTDFAINNLNLLSNDKEKLDVSISIHMTLERNNKKKAAEFVEQSTIKEALQKKIEEYKKYSAD